MRILSIETSCDETSVAIVERINDFRVQVLSETTATSLATHARTGGIIPENAARAQVEYIIPTIEQTLLKASFNKNPQDFLKHEIDAIAVTYGPGLIGSLLVVVEAAKTLAYSLNKPIIPVNHLLAHLYANFISPSPQSSPIKNGRGSKKSSLARDERERVRVRDLFPFIGLIVSGGHTDLLYFNSHTEYQWLGGTRDDAAGECLDKSGRLIGCSYPAGPEIEKKANQFHLRGGISTTPRENVKFQSPLLHSDDFDFSFSGLKAEVSRFVQKSSPLPLGEQRPVSNGTGGWGEGLSNETKNEMCYALQKAIFDVLISKTLNAAEKFNVPNILLGGGVSANQTLIEQFKLKTKDQRLTTHILAPERKYSTDNGAMIGAYAALNYDPKPWNEITANPELYFA